MALSSGNVGKYEFLTGEDVLPEKGLLIKAATIRRFEYSPLGLSWKSRLIFQRNNIKGLGKVLNFIKRKVIKQ